MFQCQECKFKTKSFAEALNHNLRTDHRIIKIKEVSR
jgi:hypothetical protein